MNPLQDGCPCAGCTTLRMEIGQDAGLVTLYGKKLLYQGWTGKMTAAERAYRLAHSTKAQAASKNARALGPPRRREPALGHEETVAVER